MRLLDYYNASAQRGDALSFGEDNTYASSFLVSSLKLFLIGITRSHATSMGYTVFKGIHRHHALNNNDTHNINGRAYKHLCRRKTLVLSLSVSCVLKKCAHFKIYHTFVHDILILIPVVINQLFSRLNLLNIKLGAVNSTLL